MHKLSLEEISKMYKKLIFVIHGEAMKYIRNLTEIDASEELHQKYKRKTVWHTNMFLFTV